MPDKFVTNLKVAGEIIKVKDENLNGTVNEIINGNINLPYVKRSGDAMTGELNMNSHKITNIQTPTQGNDVANKTYVDTKINGELPVIATETIAGIIKAAPATGEDIQDVRITPDGFLKTKASTGGGGSNITIVQTTGSSTADVMSQKAVTDKIQNISNTIPVQATDSILGTIKAAPATNLDTQDIRITPDGHLKTKASGDVPPTVVQTTGQSTGDVMSQKAVSDELVNKLNKATVTRDAAYISTAGNQNETKVLADPTAPPARPIEVGQIAVYSTTNQSYNANDVKATILVADPHSDMEAVNKRTNNTKLAKANIDDNFKRVTAVAGVNPGTESYHIITKTLNEIGEDRIPMYDANNDLLVPTTPTGNNGAASKNYVDTQITNTEPTERTALPASGTALTDNSIYAIPDTNVVGTYQFVPPANNGWAHGYFLTDAAPAITFATGNSFVNKQPTFAANTKYEFDIYKNTWAFAKVVTI